MDRQTDLNAGSSSSSSSSQLIIHLFSRVTFRTSPVAVARVLEHQPVVRECREDSFQGGPRVEREADGHGVSSSNTRRFGGGPYVTTLETHGDGGRPQGHEDCGGGPDGGHPDPHHQRASVDRLADFSFVLYH